MIPLVWCSFYRDTRFCHEKDVQNVVTGCFSRKYAQNDVTQVKLFIIALKTLLEVQNTRTVNLDVTKYNPV